MKDDPMPKSEKPDPEAGEPAAFPVVTADAEPDEVTGGDLVQMIRTGWIRFVIAGHGRIRFRPARMGELKEILLAQAAMFEEIDDRAQVLQIANARLQDEQAAIDPDMSQAEQTEKMLGLVRENRRATRKFTQEAEADRVAWWRFVHGILGQPGETFPDDDALPVWILEPSLMVEAVKHWRSIPLDPGRK